MRKESDRIDMLKHTDRGNVQRTLSLVDVTYWVTTNSILVIFALFIVEHVDGAGAAEAGIALMLIKFVGALLSIRVGRYLDKHKGYLDEVSALVIASLVTGPMFIAISFASEIWQVYLAMILVGISRPIQLTAWRILFFTSVKQNEYAETNGVYNMVYWVVEAAALASVGALGDLFGFDTVLFYAGLVIFITGFLPLHIKYVYNRRPHKNSVQWRES